MGILEIKHGLLQIAETLDFLHNNARLIHRAISPEVVIYFLQYSIIQMTSVHYVWSLWCRILMINSRLFSVNLKFFYLSLWKRRSYSCQCLLRFFKGISLICSFHFLTLYGGIELNLVLYHSPYTVQHALLRHFCLLYASVSEIGQEPNLLQLIIQYI